MRWRQNIYVLSSTTTCFPLIRSFRFGKFLSSLMTFVPLSMYFVWACCNFQRGAAAVVVGSTSQERRRRELLWLMACCSRRVTAIMFRIGQDDEITRSEEEEKIEVAQSWALYARSASVILRTTTTDFVSPFLSSQFMRNAVRQSYSGSL